MPNMYLHDEYNILEYESKKRLYFLAFQFYKQLKLYG